MSKYDWEKNQLKRIENLLQKMQIPFGYIDIDLGDGISKPAISIITNFQDIEFEVLISAQDVNDIQWLVLRCLACSIADLSVDKANEVMKLALTINYHLPETTFSLIKDFLFIENDMPLDIDLEDFDFELCGFELGLQNFLIQMNKIGMQVTSTKGILKK